MKILVVDDELDGLRAIIKAVEDEGHTVEAISDPYTARKLIIEQTISFQLAIIDKTMKPDPSAIPDDEYPEPEDFYRLGISLVQLICEREPRCPIIFLSAFLDAQDRKELGNRENVVVLDKGGVKVDSVIKLIRRLRFSSS
jgi:CheY-like chemotaxis protein